MRWKECGFIESSPLSLYCHTICVTHKSIANIVDDFHGEALRVFTGDWADWKRTRNLISSERFETFLLPYFLFSLLFFLFTLIHFETLASKSKQRVRLKASGSSHFLVLMSFCWLWFFFWCLEPHGSLMEASMISSFRFKSTRSFGVCGQPDCGRWSERRPTEQCHRMQCVHQERIRGTESNTWHSEHSEHEYRKKCSMKTQWRLNEELIIHKDFSNELHSMKTHSERRWCRTECVLICTNLYYRSGGESSVWPSADDERITM